MEDYNNTIDLRFLDSETRIYDFSILIIYHKSQDAKFINSLRSKSNYMIYTNKSTNGMQDTFGKEFLPDCVIEEKNAVSNDNHQTFLKKKVKCIFKSDTTTTHLEKTLYFCLEKISEKVNYGSTSTDEDLETNSKQGIFIYLDGDEKIDDIISAYNDIFKFMGQYKKDLISVDIILFTSSSICLFLKDGVNNIFPSSTWENKKIGYSIFCLNGESKIRAFERGYNSKNFQYLAEKNIKFGSSFLFRKGANAEQIKILVNRFQESCLIYSSTLLNHK